VGFCIEDELVHTIMIRLEYIILMMRSALSFQTCGESKTHRRMYQITVLHDFRKQEAVLEIGIATTVWRIDIL